MTSSEPVKRAREDERPASPEASSSILTSSNQTTQQDNTATTLIQNKKIKLDEIPASMMTESHAASQEESQSAGMNNTPPATMMDAVADTPVAATAPEAVDQKSSNDKKVKNDAIAITAQSFNPPEGRNYLIEEDVGIEAFLTPDGKSISTFSAIIKHRFSDFLVHEVDFSGQILHYKPYVEGPPVEYSESEIDSELTKVFDNDTDIIEKVKTLCKTAAGEPIEPIITEPILDKEKRSAIHEFFKKYFAKKLVTTGSTDKTIQIRHATENDKSQHTKARVDWSKQEGEYLEFILYKENRDTMDVLNHLSRHLKTSSKAFTFAGTKDKRGVTVQRVTGHRIAIESMGRVNESLFNTRVGNFRYVKERARLGDLTGNHFIITLRDVKSKDSSVSDSELLTQLDVSMNHLKEVGFINYYGMQRFGTRCISTHAVGVAMLAGAWDVAVELILMPKGEEKGGLKSAREHWMAHKNAKEALKLFPRHCTGERAILTSYSKLKPGVPQNSYNALQAIPRNLRLMYIHAVQSYIWNYMASQRIKQYGSRIVKGDLIALPNPLSTITAEHASENTTSETTSMDNTSQEEEEEDIAGLELSRQGKMIEVKVVETDEEALNASIEDLVLPLPGYAVQYPKNEIGDLYVSFMKNLSLDPHNMRRAQREMSLPGDYRRVISKPQNVAWKVFKYKDDNAPLSMTDLDRINGVPEPVSLADGDKTALVCEFTLESSCYATMGAAPDFAKQQHVVWVPVDAEREKIK